MIVIVKVFAFFFGFTVEKFYNYKARTTGLTVCCRDKKSEREMPNYRYMGRKFVLRQK